MNWTKPLADRFLKLTDDRAVASTNLEIAQSAVAAFLRDNGVTDVEAVAVRDATMFKTGYLARMAETAAPTQPPVGLQPKAVQNMVKVNGWWVSTPESVGQMWTIRYDLRALGLCDYGKRVRVRVRRCDKYPATGNVKRLRCFNDLNGPKYPNFYIGQPDDKSLFLYGELLTPFDYTKNHLGLVRANYPFGDGLEHDEVYQWQYPSAYGAADGKFLITVDGKTALWCETWQIEGPGTDAAGKPIDCRGLPWDLFIQAGPSNNLTVFPPDSFAKIQDSVVIEAW